MISLVLYSLLPDVLSQGCRDGNCLYCCILVFKYDSNMNLLSLIKLFMQLSWLSCKGLFGQQLSFCCVIKTNVYEWLSRFLELRVDRSS